MIRSFIQKIILLFLLSLFVSANAQPKVRIQAFPKTNILLEKNIFFSDSSSACYLSYRIPINELIFTKSENIYTAGLHLEFEIKSAGKLVERKSLSKTVSVESYEETKSSNLFAQGVIDISNQSKEFIIYPFLSITNGRQSIPLDSITVNYELTLKENIGKPIVVKSNETSCNKNKGYGLVNYGSSIPFSLDNYYLLIPVTDSTVNEIKIKIEQDGKEILDYKLTEASNLDFELQECENSIVLVGTRKLINKKYFIIKDFSYLLEEGNVKLIISADGNKPVEFNLLVVWNDKPKSVLNPEFAIRALDVIENQAKIDALLSASEQDYAKVLRKYWDDKVKSKTKAFNELENEFYRRVDYSIDNFSTVSYSNGSKSDRGKIYIKYGKPDEIKREYSNSHVVIEIWKYNQINKEFTFTDKTGLGNYILE